jgi:hypothetical protein
MDWALAFGDSTKAQEEVRQGRHMERKAAWQAMGRKGEHTGGGRRHPLTEVDSSGRAGLSAVVLAVVEEGALVTPAGAGWHPHGGQGGG